MSQPNLPVSSTQLNKSSSQNHTIQLKTKQQFIKQKLSEGFVQLKLNIQFTVDNKIKTKTRKLMVPQSYSLLQIHQDMKKNFAKVASQGLQPQNKHKFQLKPGQGIFLFIKDQKIVQLRSTVKQLNHYMTQGSQGSYLEITATTVEKFGGV